MHGQIISGIIIIQCCTYKCVQSEVCNCMDILVSSKRCITHTTNNYLNSFAMLYRMHTHVKMIYYVTKEKQLTISYKKPGVD